MSHWVTEKENAMGGRQTNQWIVGILLTYMAAFLPFWPYSHSGDYNISGKIAVILSVFIVLKITKYL
ncbi:MAG: DUF3309 family protein [Elusimicrobia bacterium]|nr:DUF3309 family protein [Elusimicrobiota bacterium]MBK9057360.1 DUF3309 family protein [Elusimicrobiota bacterium]MBK9922316.1 DUF3309 family protein [Elusimicrobiota bacterium]